MRQPVSPCRRNKSFFWAPDSSNISKYKKISKLFFTVQRIQQGILKQNWPLEVEVFCLISSIQNQLLDKTCCEKSGPFKSSKQFAFALIKNQQSQQQAKENSWIYTNVHDFLGHTVRRLLFSQKKCEKFDSSFCVLINHSWNFLQHHMSELFLFSKIIKNAITDKLFPCVYMYVQHGEFQTLTLTAHGMHMSM